MKNKKIIALLAIASALCITVCGNTAKAESKAKMPDLYYMNGFYNPTTKTLYTVDAAGNSDEWENIEIGNLGEDLEYWQNVDENNEVFVWAEIDTNGTEEIKDDLAVVIPGNESVYNDFPGVYVVDGNVIVEDVEK